MTPVKRVLFPLISVTISLALLFLLFEVLARADGDYIAHLAARRLRSVEAKPRQWLDVKKWMPRTRPDTVRVLAVGDSFTHGVVVGLSGSWPKRLEQLLNAEDESGRTYEVLNAGVGAADLRQEVETAVLSVRTLAPDLILHQLYLNDFFGSLGFRYEECGTIERTMDTFRAPHFELHSLYYLWRWKTKRVHGPRFVRFVNCYGQPARPHWRTATELFRQAQGQLDESGIRYLVFLVPSMLWSRGEYPFEMMHASIGAAVRSGVRHYVDLLPDLMERFEVAEDHWLDPDLPDAHPDAVVHAYYAERLAEILRQQGLLDLDPRSDVDSVLARQSPSLR